MERTMSALSFSGNGVKVSTGPAVVFQAGVGFDAAGAVVTTTSLPNPAFAVNGKIVSAAGALYVVDKASAATPLSYVGGGQVDKNGAVVTVDVASATAPLSSISGVNADASGA